MPEKQIKLSDGAEAAVLEEMILRLVVEPRQREQWDQEISEHHYLKNAHLVGEQLRWVVEYQGRWMALPGGSAAAYPIGARDQWIGWDDNQRRAPLRLVANNARFCVLTGPGELPHLPSRATAMNLARLSADWQQACGHPIVLAESFADAQLFRGTACKASGWKAAGILSSLSKATNPAF
jgi:hypothetical protein